MASLKGATVEREPMVFSHIHETFYSAGVEYDNIQPKQTAIMKEFEKLTINVIEGIEMKGRRYTSYGVSISIRICTNKLDCYWDSHYFFSFTIINITLKLLPLSKGNEYLLCTGLSFKK